MGRERDGRDRESATNIEKRKGVQNEKSEVNIVVGMEHVLVSVLTLLICLSYSHALKIVIDSVN